jgi:MFS family permease
MVEGREDLGNGIALNSSAFNAARLVGPALAGVLIALVGEGTVFLLNALSYVAVLAALAAMRLPQRAAAPPPTNSVGRRLLEGLAYAWGFLPMRAVLLLVALVSLVGVPYSVLLPVFASEVFGGGPRTLGLLVSASGLGALAGALYLAGRPSVRGLGRVIVVAVSLFGLGLLGFTASRALPLALPLLFLAGAGLMIQMAASNTILQTLVDDDKRGRVVSLYATAFMGMVPLGGLAAGALAERLGARATVALGGLACLAGAAAFARALPRVRELARPVYERLGVAPETAPLRQQASAAEPAPPPP